MTWIGFIPSTTSSDGDITGVTAGTGMTGGGTTGAVTLNLVGGDGITANANDMAITAAQTTITSVLNTSLVIGRDADNDIDFATDNQIIFRVGGGDNVIFKASGEIEATSLDISGDADIDGTMEADAITLGGVTVLAAVDEDNMASDSNTLVPTQQSVKAYVDANAGGAVSGNTFATDLKIGRDADNLIDFTTDNNIVIRANGENQLTLVDGALTPTTNAIVDLGTDALEFKDGYFDGTLEADAITIGGTNIVSGSVITSLGTLSTLSVDNITINGNEISSTDTNGNIDLDPHGSGKVVFHGNATKGAGQFVLNCEVNTHGVTIKGPPHSASASYTLTLPNNDGDADQVLKTDGSGNLAWVTQSGGGGSGDMTQFYLEDDDGTEVTIDNNKEVKFIGSGITTNWTDTSTGNDGDPYDLTFTVDAAQTGITSVLNASLTVGRDAHNQIDFSTDNQIKFKTNNETPVIIMKASGEIEATKFDGALEGNADTATALATTRAFQTDLASTSSANFDGSAANTHGVTGILAVGNGGTGVNSMTNLKNALDDETWTFANNVTLAGFVLDGNTITGVDDSSEFTDDDAHIMTSAAINDRFAQINADTTGTATVATTVTVTDNESTNEENLITFVAGAADGTGNHGLEMDGNLTYNPSTGGVTAAKFTGDLVGTASVATTVTITDNENTNEENAVVFTAGGDVDGGNLGLESDGDLKYNPSTGTLTTTNLDTNRKINVTSSTHFEAKGDIVYLGGGSTTQGELCYLKSDGQWAATDANAAGTSGGVLLALALGSDPDVDGMLLRGMFTLDHDPGTIADELYISAAAAGDITGTPPSGSGDIVRVVGYCMDSTNGQIWFNPSNDFIVLA